MKVRSFFIVWGLVFSLLTGLQAKEQLGYTVIEDKATIPIKTSTLQDRKVLKIRLDNGLEAVLVSDPNTDQSAATLAVEAGSWQDPIEYPGIAHFLEHMLFLGTKQFPDESGYQKYITEHGGLSNAFTTNSYTAYMFSIDNEYLKGALERFSSFFKDPLFNPSGVSRELNAIDQEYAKNFENDDIREIMVLKELQNLKHPNSRFSMGNSSTLSAVSQETLKKWYLDHYSANLMHLYVISKLPLNELVDQVVTDFKDIKDYQKKRFIPEEEISNPELEGKIVYIQPIKNVRTLTIAWELPARFADLHKTHPEKILCHILGHEGKESLLADLKKEKWAESLGCNSYIMGGKNRTLFLEVGLTDDGLNELNNVILRVFQMIARLKEQKLPKYIFDEVHAINVIDYEYQKREDAFDSTMSIPGMLINESIETFPEKNSIIQEYSAEDFKDLSDYLTPQHARFFVKAPINLSAVKPNKIEKWLQVNYAIEPIEPEVMKDWENAKPIDEITLPQENPFVPKELKVFHEKSNVNQPLIPTPKAILNDEKGLVYYAADDRYLIPKLYIYFDIKTPSVEMGKAQKAVVADLYVKGVEEALSKFSYPAAMAGLNFSIDQKNYGIGFTISGYNEKASLLFDEIIKVLKRPQISEAQFKIYKQNLLREYQNFSKETPLKRAFEGFLNAVYKNYTLKSQKAVAMRKLTFEKFEEDLQNFYKQSYVEGLVYGNIEESEAKDLSEHLIKVLDSQPFPKKEQKKPLVINLPNNEGPFIYEFKIPSQGSAALLAIEFPEYSFKNRAAQQIMMQAMNEPFFNDLRTKQQTGYIVYSMGQEDELKLFNIFTVQSNTHDPRDLLARFELFIETYLQSLGKETITKENFETIKTSLLQELEKPQNSLDDMAALLKTLAFKYEGQFDWMNKRIEGMKSLEYDEFIAIIKEVLGKANKRRLAILVKGVMSQERMINYTRIGDLGQLKKMSQFEPAQKP